MIESKTLQLQKTTEQGLKNLFSTREPCFLESLIVENTAQEISEVDCFENQTPFAQRQEPFLKSP